jgi:hypothetical protein
VDDLIRRLQNVAGFLDSEGLVASSLVAREAADEIERLSGACQSYEQLAEARAAMSEALDYLMSGGGPGYSLAAIATLRLATGQVGDEVIDAVTKALQQPHP